MPQYNPDIHHRQSIRLKGYDYSQEGAYFITICANNRMCLFGKVVDALMCLNDAGRMIWSAWEHLPERFAFVELDAFVVMPNHVHGIVAIISGIENNTSVDERRGGYIGHGFGRPKGTLPGTLGRVIQAFKSITTHEYTIGVNEHGWQPFPGRLWQRNYYEHIIRDEEALENIRIYIQSNPANWLADTQYSSR